MGKWIKKMFLGVCIFVGVSVLAACNTEQNDPEVATIGSTFEVDDLEITIGSEIKWETLDGEDVFYFPVTITNLLDEPHTLHSFYYTIFNPDGTGSGCINYLFEESIYWLGAIPAGETIETFMKFLYEGEGEYTVEFGNWEEDVVDVVISVQK